MNDTPDANEYGRALSGLTINLLVKDMHASLAFQRDVLNATVVYADDDFAAMAGYGASWMLHSDGTYSQHPLRGVVADLEFRGGGVELRLHNGDPDAAEALARAHDYVVLDASADKPHGVREVFLVDPDGYVWVVDTPLLSS
ncbi:MAG: VOC family protein [Pseudomonadota bacterium]